MPKWSQYSEEDFLRELLEQFELIPVVCDIGARYKGSNAAMLILEKGFKGILVDANPKATRDLERHLPNAEIHEAYASPHNINSLVPDECGVLSIDIDGNDYWVWGMCNKTPQVVIIEFGKRAKGNMITPYDPASPKRKDGTSKEMFIALGESKGYTFWKETGVNLFFLRNDVYSSIYPPTQTASVS